MDASQFKREDERVLIAVRQVRQNPIEVTPSESYIGPKLSRRQQG